MTGYNLSTAIKTDGTLWTWGWNDYGALGHNNTTDYSSPVQIPGTTWKSVTANSFLNNGNSSMFATKTDGTLWSWGYNAIGTLGQNNRTYYSSPVQIPGTWSERPWIHQEPGGTYFLLATKA